jgi:PBSX family phage terminase large subunit
MTDVPSQEQSENLSRPIPSKHKVHKKALGNVRRQLSKKKKELAKAKTEAIEQQVKTLEAINKVAEGKKKVIDTDLITEASPSGKLLIGDKEVAWYPQKGPQIDFLEADEDEVLFSGGRGSGKSDCLIVDPLRYCENKNFRALIIRRTMPELRELISRARALYPKIYGKDVKWKEMEKMFVFPSGAKIEFGYCNNVEDAERYRGQQYTWLGVDEITQFPNDEILEKLKASLRTTDPTLRIYIRATTNPSGAGRNWVKKRWIDITPSGKTVHVPVTYVGPDGCAQEYFVTRKWLHSTLEDNQILIKADPKYKASLASLQNENMRRQWMSGDWDAADGLAFSEFDKKTHVIAPFEVPSDWYRWRACDWGYSALAVCLWFVADYDNNVYVYREFVANGKDVSSEHKLTADKFAMEVLAREMGERIKAGYLDSSVWAKRGEMGETPADTMLRLGCSWIPSDRSPGSRKTSKMLIHKYLHKDEFTGLPKLRIFDTCKELINELSSLPLDPRDSEDVDTTSNDHAYDALRYGLSARPLTISANTGSAYDYAPLPVNPEIGM